MTKLKRLENENDFDPIKGTRNVHSNESINATSQTSTAGLAMSVSEKLVIRSLRRRFWKAFSEEDPVTALKVYLTTREEWEQIICEEIVVAEREAENHRIAESIALEEEKKHKKNKRLLRAIPRIPLGSHTTIRKNDHQVCEPTLEAKSLTILVQKSSPSSEKPFGPSSVELSKVGLQSGMKTVGSIDRRLGLLQLNLNPSDPFVLDDYKDPFDNYDIEDEDDNNTLSQSDVDDAYDTEYNRSTSLPDQKRKSLSRFRLHSNRCNQNENTRSARQAFSFISRGFGRHFEDNSTPSIRSPISSTDEIDSSRNLTSPYENDETTPLHEAARLGDYELVSALLGSASLTQPLMDCNARNGFGRTILHCVAGGITKSEASRYMTIRKCMSEQGETNLFLLGNDQMNGSQNQSSVPDGIEAPQPLRAATQTDMIEREMTRHTTSKENKAKKVILAVRRFFRDSWKHSKSKVNNRNLHSDDDSRPSTMSQNSTMFVMSEEEYCQVNIERCRTAQFMLSWSHPDDGSIHAGIGVSSNAVDNQNRTALHYAAALGRTDLCILICNHFGTMLTIVDSSSQTPCELAGVNHWNDLAAKLEARTLCYIDPYGTDEDLLLSISDYHTQTDTANVGTSPAPPFSWFETLSNEQVRRKREKRIKQAMLKLLQVTERLEQSRNARAFILSHSSETYGDLSDDSVDDKSAPLTDLAKKNTDVDVKELDEISAAKSNLFNGLNETTVELYLTFHKWNVKEAVTTFLEDPHKAFDSAGIPITVDREDNLTSNTENKDVDSKPHAVNAAPSLVCMICCDFFAQDSLDWRKLSCCKHGFCKDCLSDYLLNCAKSKSTGLIIQCPHHECESLLSYSEIKDIATNDVYDMLQETANERFILTDPSFRFCPHPGCGRAIRFNPPSASVSSKLVGTGLLELVGGVCTGKHVDDNNSSFGRTDSVALVTYEGVEDANYFDVVKQPRSSHRFCFQCGETSVHWPVSCNRLREWKEFVAKEVKEVTNSINDTEDYNDIAHKLWMKANTKPCPQCNVPIQKDEGCNHMTCRNPLCKHEFCWICRNDWKLHSSDTGGFFRCNRWVDSRDTAFDDDNIPTEATEIERALNVNDDLNDPRTMEVTYGTAMFDTRVSRRKSKEMNRFLHHYQRWSAHAESSTLERTMGGTVCERLAPVVREAIEFCGKEFAFRGKGLSFVYAAFTELLECRSMLQHSYAMSFFRYKSIDNRKYKLLRRRANEKTMFEQFQAELELMTEQISDVVARSHLRATQTQIMFLTKAAAEKRKEFSNVMINILYDEKLDSEKETETNAKPDPPVDPRFGLRSNSLAGGMLDRVSGTTHFDVTGIENTETNFAENAVQRSLYQFLARRTGVNFSLDFGDDYDDDDDDDDDQEVVDWVCNTCTFVNRGGRECAMCQSFRR